MRIYNQRFVFNEEVADPEHLLDTVENFLREKLPKDADFLRYAIVGTKGRKKIIEAAIISDVKQRLSFITPPFQKAKFVVANVVPTGVKAEVGGWVGDATPVTNVLAGIADQVITHPNVLNAALLNYGGSNVLYVEGYLLDQFFKRQLNFRYLNSYDSNKIGIILDSDIDRHGFNSAVNTIETSRATLGIKVVENGCLLTRGPVGGQAFRMKSGAFSGEVKNPEIFLEAAAKLIEKGADVIAIGTHIEISPEDLDAYFEGKIPNPFGGTEALISHTISREFNISCAHAPILLKEEEERIRDKGLVDPRGAVEVVSSGYLGSVLKGLHLSPRPVFRNSSAMGVSRDILAPEDVQAVIVPIGCCGGIPVLTAQKYNVPVIAVEENKTVLAVTPNKLGLNNVIVVKTYLEAFGVVAVMKSGVSLDSVRRPLSKIEVGPVRNQEDLDKGYETAKNKR